MKYTGMSKNEKEKEWNLLVDCLSWRSGFKGSNAVGDVIREQVDKAQGDGLSLKDQQKWNSKNKEEGPHYIRNEQARETKRRLVKCAANRDSPRVQNIKCAATRGNPLMIFPPGQKIYINTDGNVLHKPSV